MLTLTEATELFCADRLASNRSENSIRLYRTHLRELRAYLLHAFGNEDIAGIDADTLRAYKQKKAEEIGPAALRSQVLSIRALFRWLFVNGKIKSNPAAALDTPKVTRKMNKPVLKKQEYDALINETSARTNKVWYHTETEELRDKIICYLAAKEGLRVAEIRSLNVGDFRSPYAEDGVSFLVFTRKGGNEFKKEIRAELREMAEGLLAEYGDQPDDAPMFVGRAGSGQRMTTDGIRKMLRRRAESMLGKEGVHPHMLRRTFITNFYYASGRDLYNTMREAGHVSMNTTLGYITADVDELRKVKEKI